MRIPHSRHLWAIAIFAVIAVLFFVWIGVYLKLRKDSYALNLGTLGTYRELTVPPEIPDQAMKLFAPLALLDGWINGESVRLGRPIFSTSPPNIGHGFLPEDVDTSIEPSSPKSVANEELSPGESNPAIAVTQFRSGPTEFGQSTNL